LRSVRGRRVWKESCQLVETIRRKRESPLQVQERRQLFIRTHNETLPIAALCVSDPDCSPVVRGNLAFLTPPFARILSQLSPASNLSCNNGCENPQLDCVFSRSILSDLFRRLFSDFIYEKRCFRGIQRVRESNPCTSLERAVS
jgi:hypothetical protein